MDYTKYLNHKIVGLKPSGIRKYFDIAATMPDCISLGVGEPNFVTPKEGIDGGVTSLLSGHTHYTSNGGIMELRELMSYYIHKKYALEYDPSCEILPTIGVSEAVDITMRALLNPGDEVLVSDPCYVSYYPAVTMAGGVPVVVETTQDTNFILTPEALEKAITPKTKVLLMCYPNNPTGAIMTREELEAIVPVIKKHDLIVVTDEVYSELTYGGIKHTSIAALPGMKERTVLLSGFSKSFAMTGWRLGYLAAPKEIYQQVYKIHQFAIMCVPTMAQEALIALLKHGFETDFDFVEEMRQEYDRKRKFIYKALLDMGLNCFEPKGAFYIFPQVSHLGLDDEAFVEKLLYDKKVAVVPGSAFSETDRSHVRISYAYSMERLERAMERMSVFVEELKKGQ